MSRERKAKGRSAEERAMDRALDAISRMRSHGLSLNEAAKAAGTSPATVRKYAPGALRRIDGDDYAATRSDRYARTLYFLTDKGKVSVTVQDSRTASLIAKHWAAVDRFEKTGHTDRLQPFVGLKLPGDPEGRVFLTDTRTIDRLAHAGEISFEELYAFRG